MRARAGSFSLYALAEFLEQVEELIELRSRESRCQSKPRRAKSPFDLRDEGRSRGRGLKDDRASVAWMDSPCEKAPRLEPVGQPCHTGSVGTKDCRDLAERLLARVTEQPSLLHRQVKRGQLSIENGADRRRQPEHKGEHQYPSLFRRSFSRQSQRHFLLA